MTRRILLALSTAQSGVCSSFTTRDAAEEATRAQTNLRKKDPVYSRRKRGSRSCGEASLTSSSRQEEREGQLLRSLEGLLVRDSAAAFFFQERRGERGCG